jgi:hypothetical protein
MPENEGHAANVSSAAGGNFFSAISTTSSTHCTDTSPLQNTLCSRFLNVPRTHFCPLNIDGGAVSFSMDTDREYVGLSDLP